MGFKGNALGGILHQMVGFKINVLGGYGVEALCPGGIR